MKNMSEEEYRHILEEVYNANLKPNGKLRDIAAMNELQRRTKVNRFKASKDLSYMSKGVTEEEFNQYIADKEQKLKQRWQEIKQREQEIKQREQEIKQREQEINEQQRRNFEKLSNLFGDSKTARCPRCKSTSITYDGSKPSVGRAVVGGAVAGPAGAVIGGMTGKKGYAVCLKCGKRWKV